MSDRPEYLLWLDLETTGADEHLDPILEVGFVITNTNLDQIDSGYRVVKPGAEFDGWQDRMVDVVREMHTANGLLLDIEGEGGELVKFERELIETMGMYGKKHDFILAGSGVAHFDRRFLAAQMPALTKWLRYYSIDVGVLRRSFRMMGRDDLLLAEQPKSHRGLDDALYHLAEFRHIKEALA